VPAALAELAAKVAASAPAGPMEHAQLLLSVLGALAQDPALLPVELMGAVGGALLRAAGSRAQPEDVQRLELAATVAVHVLRRGGGSGAAGVLAGLLRDWSQ
jgi:hypothetical protein